MRESNSRITSEYLQEGAPEEMEGVSKNSWHPNLPTLAKSDSVVERGDDSWKSSSTCQQVANGFPVGVKPINNHFLAQKDASYTSGLPSPFRVPSLAPSESASLRRLHLSRSPLDHLQAEFKKYGNASRQWNLDSSKRRETTDDDNTTLDTQDWSFVKRRLELPEHAANYDCPSMTTASTLSSRNSSTRSTKSNKWDGIDQSEKGMCPIPECGRMMRDLAAHLLTHQAERPEKCPIETCEYHVKGFARPYDKVRHTLTHYTGTFVCGFCPVLKATHEKTFPRCDAFLRHLVNAHGVEQGPAGRRDEPCQTQTPQQSRRLLGGQAIATCSLCTEPFDAQGCYEHLKGCVLRQVTRGYSTPNPHKTNPVATVEANQIYRNNSIISVESDAFTSSHTMDREEYTAGHSQPVAPPIDHSRRNSQDHTMEALTASSRCLSLTSSHGDGELNRSSSDDETDWTEDAGSPDSAPDTEGFKPILSPVKIQLVNSIMAEFHKIFDKGMRSHNGGGATSGASGYRESSGSSSYSSASFISRKRSLSGGSTPPNNDGDDPHKRRRPDPKAAGSKHPLPEVRFACPYYKRNPGRHQTYTSCRDPGFIAVSRLKEHLYRRHLLPIQCNRCCATFPNEPTLREHQRDVRGCEVKEHIPLEGFDKDQERKLKSKKRSLVYQSEEDKWKGVYKILFPDDNEEDMPSPYIEYQPCKVTQTGESSNIAQFHEFSRLELPRLVRRTLEVVVEEEAQPLEEKLKERLVDIVQDCQSQLISLFQTTHTIPVEASELTAALLLPDGEPPRTGSQQHRDQNDRVIMDPSFQDFDSFALAVTSSEFIPVPTTQEVETAASQVHYKPPIHQEPASDSPDSGYDSNTAWQPNSSSLQQSRHYQQNHRHCPHYQQQQHEQSTSFHVNATTSAFTTSMPMYTVPSQHPGVFEQSAGFIETEYPAAADMEGYRGMVEACDMRFVQRVPDPAWTAYGNSAFGSNGNGNVMLG